MILEGGQMGEVMGGYFIRRVVTPEIKLGLLPSNTSKKKMVAGSTPHAGNSAENLIRPIAGHVAGHGSETRPKHKKSPLPDWYPRTPLRDISVICKAIQRMNMRIDMTPHQMDPTTYSTKKPSPAQIQLQTPEPTNSIFSSKIQLVKPNLTVLDFTPIKVEKTPEIEAYEKKLTESIEKLERIVKRNMKREKLKQNTTTRVLRRDARCKMLMSMR